MLTLISIGKLCQKITVKSTKFSCLYITTKYDQTKIVLNHTLCNVRSKHQEVNAHPQADFISAGVRHQIRSIPNYFIIFEIFTPRLPGTRAAKIQTQSHRGRGGVRKSVSKGAESDSVWAACEGRFNRPTRKEGCHDHLEAVTKARTSPEKTPPSSTGRHRPRSPPETPCPPKWKNVPPGMTTWPSTSTKTSKNTWNNIQEAYSVQKKMSDCVQSTR